MSCERGATVTCSGLMRTLALLGFFVCFGCGGDGSSGSEPSGGSGGASGGGGGTSAAGGTLATGGGGTASGGTQGGSCNEPPHTGEATYYDFADGSGNCGFDKTPNDLMVGAMNHTDYADSAVCGMCASIDGPSGSVTVRVVDQCPECKPGDIDLSPQAFEKIALLSLGRVPITWRYVPCGVSGPIRYRFKEGSNQWWTALSLRNHRHGIKSLEYKKDDGSFVSVNRESYNYFVEPAGMGPGPYTFRVTDVYGQVLMDSGIVHAEATEVEGAAQFPACP